MNLQIQDTAKVSKGCFEEGLEHHYFRRKDFDAFGGCTISYAAHGASRR